MRFPPLGLTLLALIWALIFAVPSLRHQTLMGADVPNVALLVDPTLNVNEALKTTPNDPFLRSEKLQADWKTDQPDSAQHFFRAYDELLAQNPTQLGLWRNRLRFAARGGIVHERYTVKYLRAEAAKQNLKSNVRENRIWLNDQQLRQVVVQAHRASQLAPREAFFPFIEAMALCGLNREEEALTALQRAGNCPVMNDGTTDQARRRIEFMEGQGPLDWDEKLVMVWSTLLPQFGGMRALIRELAYSGVYEYRAGREAEAWRRWNIALRGGRIIREGNQSNYIGVLVGEATESATWDIVCKAIADFDASKALKQKGEVLSHLEATHLIGTRAEAFERLARRDGQQQIADFSRSEAAAITARRDLPPLGGDVELYEKALGWKSLPAAATVQARWFGWQTLLLAVYGVLGFALCVLVTRGGRETGLKLSTVGNTSAFFVALWVGAGLWALCHGAGVGDYRTLLEMQATDTTPFSSSFFLNGNPDWNQAIQWFLELTVLGIFASHFWRQLWAGKQNSVDVSLRNASLYPFWSGLAWLIALTLSVALWIDGLNFNMVTSQIGILLPFWLATVAVALFLTGKADLPGENRQFKLACCVALGLLSSILMMRPNSDLLVFSGILLGLGSVSVLLLSLRKSWTGFKPFLLGLRAPLELTGRVVTNLAVVLSLAYVVALLALWPVKQNLNQKIDEYVRLGEVDWMRAHHNGN